MIEQHEAMAVLLEACPSFQSDWEAHLAYYGPEMDYLAAGDFARHLLTLYRANDTACFPTVALVIERLHTEGYHSIREFATIGILKAIQNNWSGEADVDPEYFSQFLGPESKRWWLKLNAFWNGDPSALSE